MEGAGNINAFDPATGAFLGHLQQPDGTPIAIPGLWDLTFGGGSRQRRDQATLLRLRAPMAEIRRATGSSAGSSPRGTTGNGQGAVTDNAAVTVAKSTIVGLAPLPPATATGPEATAYGWLIDIAPERWRVHDDCPPGQEQQDQRGRGARGIRKLKVRRLTRSNVRIGGRGIMSCGCAGPAPHRV